MSKLVTLGLMFFGDVSIRAIVVKELSDGLFKVVHPQPRVVKVAELRDNELPIFLTKDVCSMIEDPGKSSGIMTRFTRKMHSCRLNTKVCFKDVIVEGINNSSVINFVAIEALYMAIFTGVNTDMQKRVAPCLLETWMAHCHKKLPENIEYYSVDDWPPASLLQAAATSQGMDRNSVKPFDELLECVDTCLEQPDYISDLRSLLNSYRSLCVKHGAAEFSQVLKKEEELIQSLISHDNEQCVGMKDAMLEVASGWIGREFRALQPSIQKSVTKFKSENIGSISKLPAARATCGYFPRPMVVLFEHWLSSCDDLDSAHNSEEPQYKHFRKADTDIYPFIQLLLEFANNTLISGVAHVVYTQLLKDPT